MDEAIDEDPVNWKKFHNTTREYVIFLLFFLFLNVASYLFISLFRKKLKSYPDCYEDAFVNRISLWLSSFSFSISLGAALLLPISIISNEVLLLYPNSYYVQWLNSSLIQGLWNLVFLFSNLSLFLFLPFSHFILESEGFPGSPKGIMARVNEAALVLALTGLVIMGIICMISAILDTGPYIIQPAFNKTWKSNIYGVSSYYLPFLYSCVSFLGVLMLLLCTPIGFARLFSVMNDLLTRHKIYVEQPDYIENEALPTIIDGDSKFDDAAHNLTTYKRLYHTVSYLESKEDFDTVSNLPDADLKYIGDELVGPSRFSISSLRKNCLYPFVMFVLVLLTMLDVLTVSQNTLELCFGVKSLPVYSQNLSLGIASLSSLGPAGASLEILMILYLYCTSIVGLYSLPLFHRLRPKLSSTSLHQIVGNCAILLVLSSALPVLARSLGITNFDLLGDFGRINWLGNFYIVLFHNIVFAGTVAICLGKKVHSYLYPERLSYFPYLSKIKM